MDDAAGDSSRVLPEEAEVAVVVVVVLVLAPPRLVVSWLHVLTSIEPKPRAGGHGVGLQRRVTAGGDSDFVTLACIPPFFSNHES